MKKIPCITFFIFCFSLFIKGQEESGQYIRKGLFRSAGTFAAGTFLHSGNSTIYLQGTAEYYLNEKVSLRGDGFYGLKVSEEEHELMKLYLISNDQLFSGASYHFKTNSHLDAFVGLQTGIAIARSGIEYGLLELVYPEKPVVNPLFAVNAGLNYYFQKWFHLFLEARYVHATHIARGGSIPLSELRFSFGLGWNMNFIREKTGT
ncbi:MAG: hypothetical protein SH856_04690 [Flavobacteriales bacterium]|nr:hypothetical protein [Flavobacteriales bacterium]